MISNLNNNFYSNQSFFAPIGHLLFLLPRQVQDVTEIREIPVKKLCHDDSRHHGTVYISNRSSYGQAGPDLLFLEPVFHAGTPDAPIQINFIYFLIENIIYTGKQAEPVIKFAVYDKI